MQYKSILLKMSNFRFILQNLYKNLLKILNFLKFFKITKFF